MMMKAAVYAKYGAPLDVLQLTEVEKPAPDDHEVLVRVHAVSINAADWRIVKAEPFLARFTSGLIRPKLAIPGADMAGRVERVGRSVTLFQPGDEVFGDLSACGFGAFAQYVCASERALVLKPAAMTFREAAAVPMAAVTALQGLRDKGNIQAGMKVLIHGASGGVGTFAVQLAKSSGAEVTAVCSTTKMDLARSLGADHVVDYAKEEFTRSGHRYDLILGVGGERRVSNYLHALSREGMYVNIGGSMTQMFQAMLLGPLMPLIGRRRMVQLQAKPNRTDLTFVANLIESGRMTPVIDRIYPSSQLPEAMTYLLEGRARGKVIVDMTC